jgi:heme/copper-type cytochrome/quinol oxidase subunit 2
VNSKIAAGDVAGAQEASAKAKKFSMIAIIVGVVCWVLLILFYLIVGIAAFSTSR